MDYLVSTVSYIFPFLIVLGIVVFIHEFGHYIVAKMCKVKVEEFSIGFGKEIWGFNDKSGTRWKISLIPLGGFVKMYGDANEASAKPDEKVEELSDEEKKFTFHYQPKYKKIPIIFAGPLANYIFSVLVIWGIFAFVGKIVIPPVVGDVIANTAASEAGMQKGDRILSINGKNIESFIDIQRIVSSAYEGNVELQVKRGESLVDLSVKPRVVEEKDKYGNVSRKVLLGVISVQKTDVLATNLGAKEAFTSAVKEVYDTTENTLLAVWQMIKGVRSADELGGPIRIAEVSGEIANSEGGSIDFLFFIAILSVNLGLINLLPIPLLDGGQIVFYTIEAIIRKPIGDKAQDIFARIGYAFIITLMVFATWNDITRLFRRWF